ncbi:M24 family metallopeptidase [Aerococcus sanguinicola]|uniref:Aminopeptidase P family protein n=1 Tax=Aerococcus sanguinicola TaxID=119206 RepID=A0A0X8FDT3_9LACT|nr:MULTISPECIES: Xaa-Pro peptidase family protein [Aerococcus]AMB94687.1 peptidase M24 [Aerococcus sanguinicola]MDK7050898.1 Xaa-Pro peptidase family protein [Aerococcus sanguinicola]OFT96585.1 peptidase M24 [Aerococcus sp. HMSC23C02]PKZ23313.1 aminopeptidase P family protein [Aerococcus sanguinicola]
MKRRIKKLQDLLKEEDIKAFYVSNPYNIRYLSGFTGTSAKVLVTQEKAYLITDFRYREQAESQCPDLEVVIAGGSASQDSPLAFIKRTLNAISCDHLAFEDEDVSVASYMALDEALEIDLVPFSGAIEVLRQFKDEEEIALIEKACEIAVQTYDFMLNEVKVGMTEIELANAIDFHMRSLGASGVSFDTIVASGLRSAMPHGVASQKKIEQGDLITVDYGCYYQGYCSDMTRTFALGDPGAKLKEIYPIVQEANRRVSQAARPGISGQALDAVARDYISQAGYGDAFGHSLGHSIGLEIHEAPNASPSYDEALQVGQLITNEPGIYLEGIGGVRIEDDLVITEEGNRILTPASRELIIL